MIGRTQSRKILLFLELPVGSLPSVCPPVIILASSIINRPSLNCAQSFEDEDCVDEFVGHRTLAALPVSRACAQQLKYKEYDDKFDNRYEQHQNL